MKILLSGFGVRDIVNMTGKKTAGQAVKGMASSVKKGTGKKKNGNKGSDLSGSFLQSPETVQTVSNFDHTTSVDSTQSSSDNSDTILAYLKKLDESNQALLKRVSDLEANKSLPSTPSPRSQCEPSHSLIMHAPVGQGQGPRVTIPVTKPRHTQDTAAASISAGQIQNTQLPADTLAVDHQPLHYNTDGVIASVTTLRQNPTISQSVAQVMASYEAQAK